MAEYVLTTPTEVAVGAAVPYNQTIVPGCCDIRHRSPGVITIKGSGCCKCPKKYKVNFHAVVTGVIGAMQLGIYLDGELLGTLVKDTETFEGINAGPHTLRIEYDGRDATSQIMIETDKTYSTSFALAKK